MATVTENNPPRERWHILFAAFAVAMMVVLTACEEKTTGEKIGDAVDDVADGVEDAGDELRN